MSSADPPRRIAVRGDLLDLVSDPGFDPGTAGSPPAGVRWRPDHWLLVEDGRIVGTRPGNDPPDDRWERHDHAGKLITPGLVDTHVHSPQIDVIGSYGTQLLDWLETYTFPAERRHADPAYAVPAAAHFLDALLAHGTTSAVVFPTVHPGSVDALFEAGLARGMRVVAGKILMDRHAPDYLRDDVDQAERDCVDLIERWHGRERLSYAVTPRFAPTSSDAQLAMAGRLCAAFDGLYMQTHVAENRDEVRWVAELFPDARSYLDVYARHGLLNARSVLAHGIWLDDDDRRALAQAGAQVAHCPSSNLFLGSGLFDWRQAADAGVAVSLASDVGGGTSLSMLRAMADAYKVQAMAGTRLPAWQALWACTHGAARALGLSHEFGHLSDGTLADLAVWDWAAGPVARRRDALADDLHQRLFAFMTLGDDRNLASTWVAGRPAYLRRGAPS